MASNRAETQIRINPTPKMMINTEPMSSSNPVVENNPTPDFCERFSSERLAKKADIIENAQRMINTAKIPTRKGARLLIDRFEGLGVKPERAVQSPFQSGNSVYRRSFNEVKTVKMTTAIETTIPTIPKIKP
jgi:hypothetical protein